MMSAEVVRMRGDYAALMRVADGIAEMLRAHQVCNAGTFACMAQEARAAAHHLASEIERLLFGAPQAQKPENRAPERKRGLKGVILGLVAAVCALIV